MSKKSFHTPEFKAAWWLKNPHLQTLWAEVLRKRIDIPLTHERFELADGDFLDLSWSQTGFHETVILLHGLGGSVDSPYMRGMIHALNELKFNTVAVHFRGCSREPNRLSQMFHAGQTEDLAEVIDWLISKSESKKFYAIGFSIGANILLKYVGEREKTVPLLGAIAVSTPLSLEDTQATLSTGFSRLYQHFLLTKLKVTVLKKFIMQNQEDINLLSIALAKDMKHFDDLLTAPMHGFKDAADYYSKASSISYLDRIAIPTLIVHAKDDPFLPETAIKWPKNLSEFITLVLCENGGHVGFVSGDSPQATEYWLENIVPKFISDLSGRRRAS